MESNELEKIKDFIPNSQTTSIFSGWQAAQVLNYAVALWRLPQQTEKQLIVNFSNKITKTKLVFEELPAGFAFSPFLNENGNETLFIEADLYCRFDENGKIHTEKLTNSVTPAQRKLWEKCIGQIAPAATGKASSIHSLSTDASSYLHSVQEAMKAIESGEIKKVVLSRMKRVELPADFVITEMFERLCEQYPNAFVSMVYLPHLEQIWLGATPETLVGMNKEGIFKTVALAGTQSAFDTTGQLIPTKQALWSQKEIEEQALVSRYIISCFKKIRVREYIEEGPKSVRAGNLIHLLSDYTVDTQAINFPEIGTVILELLHPTSAVCGMPKIEALRFIREHEGYNREFYSGYLGPVNIEDDTQLFVNLRCMKIEKGNATLYAGGGITEDFIPAKEWQETELKMQTMLAVL